MLSPIVKAWAVQRENIGSSMESNHFVQKAKV